MKEVKVVYTRWRNLKKTKSMEAGQIGFHDPSKVIAGEGVRKTCLDDTFLILQQHLWYIGPDHQGSEV
jgi:hypothetical protein